MAKRTASGLIVLLIASHVLQPRPAQAQAQAAIAACGAQPQTCLLVGVIGGTYVIWRYGPKLLCTGANCVQVRQNQLPRNVQKMLQDPDARTESASEYIWAANDAQAQRNCENFVRRKGGFNARVRRTNNWSNAQGKFRYDCSWDYEVTEYGNDRRNH